MVARPVELADEAGVALGVGPQVPDRAAPLPGGGPARRRPGRAPRTATASAAGSSSSSVRLPGGTWRISSSATTTVRDRGRLRPRCQ
ncbi:hypothetical protein [Actinomadura madurae]|uniref:hypothetical protein n=1 Tax=Actinomadura madurae TaxID=1993 RepID=UPI0020D2209C|nr:hypothetical protein [Actinomadura madurae]MCQ0004742.1 hypothetical protein [Actinomadura madurae]